MPYTDYHKSAEFGKAVEEHLKSSKDTQNSLLAAGMAGGLAKSQGKSGGEAAMISLVVGFGAKLLGAGIRAFLKK